LLLGSSEKSEEKIMASNVSQILTGQLIDFGLNPQHWNVSNESNCWAELTHIDDPELKLHAVLNLTANSLEIECLELLEL
jgi:hypothetical protein